MAEAGGALRSTDAISYIYSNGGPLQALTGCNSIPFHELEGSIVAISGSFFRTTGLESRSVRCQPSGVAFPRHIGIVRAARQGAVEKRRGISSAESHDRRKDSNGRIPAE